MPIPSELAIWLKTETPAIQDLAYLNSEKEQSRLEFNNTTQSECFMERLGLLKQRDRLLGRTIHEAQAEVARLHGLSYLKLGNESRWVTSDDPRLSAEQRKLIVPAGKQEQGVLIGGRSKNYFEKRPTGLSSLPKVDVGLLAHAFQLPIDSLLMTQDIDAKQFGLHLEWTRAGRNLFATGLSLLDEFAQRDRGEVVVEPLDPSLEITPLPRTGAGVRGLGGSTFPQQERFDVMAGMPIRIRIEVPDSFQPTCEALVLERDQNQHVSLLSTHFFLGQDPRFTDAEEIVLPGKLPNKTPGQIILNPPGVSDVYVLWLRSVGDDPKLARLPAYQRTRDGTGPQPDEFYFLGEEDFRFIRQLLLKHSQSDWRIVKKRIYIGESRVTP